MSMSSILLKEKQPHFKCLFSLTYQHSDTQPSHDLIDTYIDGYVLFFRYNNFFFRYSDSIETMGCFEGYEIVSGVMSLHNIGKL